MQRNSWDKYFLDIASIASVRSTCDRLHVGSVLVRDHQILSTGYNGSVRGLGHCDEEGHIMIGNSCQRTIHSEQNAIAQAARNGVSVLGATLYVTNKPCINCAKLVLNAGIIRIVYLELYRHATSDLDVARDSILEESGIEIMCFSEQNGEIEDENI
jgi:dCMP deaminase